jgi:6-pyruvoyltetrahydropterin/6-carboxytetrahydropterin synthase
LKLKTKKGVYKVGVSDEFSAAHQLVGSGGKCEHLHGHNWKVEIVVTGTRLNSNGMLRDFQEMKSKLESVLAKLDHRNLNQLPCFRNVPATSENIARYIYKKFRVFVPSGLRLEKTTVWESRDSYATYLEP